MTNLTHPSFADSWGLVNSKTGDLTTIKEFASYTKSFFTLLNKNEIIPIFANIKPPAKELSWCESADCMEMLLRATKFAARFPGYFSKVADVFTWLGYSTAPNPEKRELQNAIFAHWCLGKARFGSDFHFRLVLGLDERVNKPLNLGCSEENIWVPRWAQDLLNSPPGWNCVGIGWRKFDRRRDLSISSDDLIWHDDNERLFVHLQRLMFTKMLIVPVANLARLVLTSGSPSLIETTIRKAADLMDRREWSIEQAPEVIRRAINSFRSALDQDDYFIQQRFFAEISDLSIDGAPQTRKDIKKICDLIGSSVREAVLPTKDGQSRLSRSANNELLDFVGTSCHYLRDYFRNPESILRTLCPDVVNLRIRMTFRLSSEEVNKIDEFLFCKFGLSIEQVIHVITAHLAAKRCVACSTGPPEAIAGLCWDGEGLVFLAMDWIKVIIDSILKWSGPNELRGAAKLSFHTVGHCPGEMIIALKNHQLKIKGRRASGPKNSPISRLENGVFGIHPTRMIDCGDYDHFSTRVRAFHGSEDPTAESPTSLIPCRARIGSISTNPGTPGPISSTEPSPSSSGGNSSDPRGASTSFRQLLAQQMRSIAARRLVFQREGRMLPFLIKLTINSLFLASPARAALPRSEGRFQFRFGGLQDQDNSPPSPITTRSQSKKRRRRGNMNTLTARSDRDSSDDDTKRAKGQPVKRKRQD